MTRRRRRACDAAKPRGAMKAYLLCLIFRPERNGVIINQTLSSYSYAVEIMKLWKYRRLSSNMNEWRINVSNANGGESSNEAWKCYLVTVSRETSICGMWIKQSREITLLNEVMLDRQPQAHQVENCIARPHLPRQSRMITSHHHAAASSRCPSRYVMYHASNQKLISNIINHSQRNVRKFGIVRELVTVPNEK